MAIAKGSITQGYYILNWAKSFTFSHTVDAGSNKCLIVRIISSGVGNNDPSGVTYNGDAMTKISSMWDSNSNQKCTFWYLVNPDEGTHDVEVTWATYNYACVYSATNFTGVHQSSPIDTHAEQASVGSGTSVSLNFTTNYANSMMYDLCEKSDGYDWAPGSGTEDFNITYNTWKQEGCYRALGTNTTYTQTWSGKNTYRMLMLIALREAPVTSPTVTTQDADEITPISCRGNGNITATGGANATRRGFCYKAGTSGDPTTSDSVAYDDGSFGTGAFTKSITGLTPGTSYRVRAYAVNSAGTSYGTTVQVETLEAFIPRTMWFN